MPLYSNRFNRTPPAEKPAASLRQQIRQETLDRFRALPSDQRIAVLRDEVRCLENYLADVRLVLAEVEREVPDRT